MKIDILTLFPNMFSSFLNESIIKRAKENRKIEINIHNIRDFSIDKHKKVDDYPFGGGYGMVLMCQPVFEAVNSLKSENTKVILMTPSGEVFNQDKAYNLSREEHIIIICGHYEGFDDRISTLVNMEISIGDYILTGGEIPGMVITDAIIRLVDGVINKESLVDESFNNELLDYPNYTKPREFNGLLVPEILLSGNHKKIAEWRLNERIKRTKEKRPDLLDK